MASHHPTGKRYGGLARWGTSLAGVVVTVIATGGLAWASGLVPARMAPVSDGGVTGSSVTLSITSAAPARDAGVYPGGVGDVAFAITNPGPRSVLITGVRLPPSESFATGSRAGSAVTACSAATSTVAYRGSVAGAPSAHLLATPLTIGAGQTVVVTMSGGATMQASAPPACQGLSFTMPPLAGVIATASGSGAGAARVTDSWSG